MGIQKQKNYWVDEHPLPQGTSQSFDRSTYVCCNLPKKNFQQNLVVKYPNKNSTNLLFLLITGSVDPKVSPKLIPQIITKVPLLGDAATI